MAYEVFSSMPDGLVKLKLQLGVSVGAMVPTLLALIPNNVFFNVLNRLCFLCAFAFILLPPLEHVSPTGVSMFQELFTIRCSLFPCTMYREMDTEIPFGLEDVVAILEVTLDEIVTLRFNAVLGFQMVGVVVLEDHLLPTHVTGVLLAIVFEFTVFCLAK